MRLTEELESLIENGPQSSRFDIELSSVLRELRQDWGRSPEQIRVEICESETEHPLVSFLVGLSRWIEDREYHHGAEPALDDLREAIDTVIEEDWSSLFPILVIQRIDLLSDLNHESELKAEVKLALFFLVENKESIAIDSVFRILETIAANLNSVSGTPTIGILIDYLEAHAERAITAEDYRNHRKLWRQNLEVRDSEGLDTGPAIAAIIKSYNDELESLKTNEKHSIRATIAKEAITECNEWIDESQRVEWEQEFIEGNKLSIEQMAEITHEPSEEDISELDDAVEGLVKKFRDWKNERNAIFAIKWLLNHNIFAPDIEVARDISEGSIMGFVQRITVSQAGESYSQDESTIEDLPHSYGAMVQFIQSIRQSVYYRLQNRGLLTEGDLFVLFNTLDVLSADTHAYITDFVIHLFEHNHSAAVHIGMTQLEAVIRTLAADSGKSVLSQNEETGELKRRSMAGVLYQVEEELSESWVTYLRYRYGELSGQNLRNQIAHGYLPYPQASWGMSITLLFDILQTFLEFEKAYA
ncbi:hypothetical protein C2R22_04975 [Salinigranum rubrum]|uniref:DUF4209 domain-containing protein n=1 Tax=Salinigranum rubrum TaxID=755307 RepID=A0A2I8VGP6_9EURY|nr:DUF4209 domain-containing protein [Salinigranum rubrum]AUV81091.1 hypothetical protein C2R22_04975 [Salinigranum rubrum]